MVFLCSLTYKIIRYTTEPYSCMQQISTMRAILYCYSQPSPTNIPRAGVTKYSPIRLRYTMPWQANRLKRLAAWKFCGLLWMQFVFYKTKSEGSSFAKATEDKPGAHRSKAQDAPREPQNKKTSDCGNNQGF